MSDRQRGQARRLAGMALHQMADQFQVRHMEKQCEELLECLDQAISLTEEMAPLRMKSYCLGRVSSREPDAASVEARWERAIWTQYGKDWKPGAAEFLEGRCRFVKTYQMPLKESHEDKDWGKLDLIGVSAEGLPVVVELKKPEAIDTPLRFLVEAAAYGVALRKAWNKGDFFRQWSEALGFRLPKRIDRCDLLCAAPADYWSRSRQKVTEQGWNALRKVVARFAEKGLSASFAELGCEDRTALKGIRAAEIIPWTKMQ